MLRMGPVTKNWYICFTQIYTHINTQRSSLLSLQKTFLNVGLYYYVHQHTTTIHQVSLWLFDSIEMWSTGMWRVDPIFTWMWFNTDAIVNSSSPRGPWAIWIRLNTPSLIQWRACLLRSTTGTGSLGGSVCCLVTRRLLVRYLAPPSCTWARVWVCIWLIVGCFGQKRLSQAL